MTGYKIIFLFLCCFLVMAVYAQETVIPASRLMQNAPVVKEKMYAHTDKSMYLSGEILWFKLYTVDAASNRLLELSKIAYVELVDSLQTPVMQAKISLRNGLGNGSFSLPLSVSSGSYKLRAYTSWMKNGSPGDFFQKDIVIINPQKLTVNKQEKTGNTYTVHFFPEGGNLVYNLQSHVAFRGNDRYGSGFPFTGKVLDGNDTLLTFQSDDNGIGSFDFLPMKNHSYRALVKMAEGNSFSQPLSAINEKGYVMNVTHTDKSNMLVRIAATGRDDNDIYLLIHKNNTTITARQNRLTEGKTTFTVPDSLLPAGASFFTILNSNKQPVCERLYFKNNFDTLLLSVSSDYPVYDTRQKVELSMSAPDISGRNDSAFLSLSVYRLDSLQALDEDRIDDYFFYTSELKAGVNRLRDYTDTNALNNLALVSSQNHFVINEDNRNSKPLFAFAPEYNGHIITGKILTRSGQAEQGVRAYLSVTGKGSQFYSGVTDANGIIRWEAKDFFGASHLVVQTKDGDGYKIQIDTPFSRSFSSSPFPRFSLPYYSPNTLSEHNISMQVSHIYSESKLEQYDLPTLDSTPFYLTADKRYWLDDFTRFTTLEEVLREYVVMVNVARRKGDFHLPVYDYASKEMFTNDPLVLLDGVPYFNLNRFMSLDPQKIQKLDVVFHRFFYGASVFDGILNWQSYNGELAETSLDPNAIVVDYEGLALQRKFYSPDYETEKQRNSNLPDFRNVLYWNPDIILNDKQHLSFYTSNFPGTYVAFVQGITQSGKAGSRVIKFEVKKR